jgi:tetratricopeptide (TPR) repeat protein
MKDPSGRFIPPDSRSANRCHDTPIALQRCTADIGWNGSFARFPGFRCALGLAEGGHAQENLESVMHRVFIVAAVAALALAPDAATTQFWDKMTNPRISVAIKHPPDLGLQVNKVAFGPAKGEAAEQFIDGLTERFVRSGVEVIERAQLEAMLAEHSFSLSGYVDASSASEIGKILGPSVLIFANVPRHTSQQKKLYDDWKDGKGYPHRTYISRTQAFARGSIRAVDLATGRIFAAQTLQAQPMLENKVNDECCPEFPSDIDLLDAAMGQIVEQAQRLFLPYTETRQVYYFDDKDCNLKTAHAFMKSGSVEAALQQSLTNLEACKALPKAKEKNLSHALHNVGMGYFATGQLDKALEFLNQAQQTKPGDIGTEAISVVMQARAEAEKMRRVEERMVLEEELGARKRAAAPAAQPAAAVASGTSASVGARGLVKGTKSPTKAPEAPAPAMPPSGSGSIEDRLQKLDSLLKKGLITRPEYDKKKAELLKEL